MQKTLKKIDIRQKDLGLLSKKYIKMKQSFIQGSNSIVCGKIA